MTEEVKTLRDWIDHSGNIVFFGGAGVSTESGIPDFRSVDGLYNQEYDYPPETILSHSFYERNPEEFYRFYRNKMLCLDAKPNAAHRKLAELEERGTLKAVITQNIDGLHQKAVRLRRDHQAGCGAVRRGAGSGCDSPGGGSYPSGGGAHHRRHVSVGVPGSGAGAVLPGEQAGGYQ